MINRKIISTTIALVFIILIITGLLMYFNPFTKTTASLHTLAGLLFIIFALFHVVNNFKSLKSYNISKKNRMVISKSPMIISIILIVIVLGVMDNNKIVNWLYEYGNQYRAQIEGTTGMDFNYEIINVQPPQSDIKIEIEIKKGKSYNYPIFVIWMEDLEGNYLETLYVSKAIATSTFQYGSEDENGEWVPDIVRRPEAVPFWAHQRGIKAKDGLFVPYGQSSDLDGVSGATPIGNFLIESGLPKELKEPFRILLEVNQSYDWNEFYTKDRYPDDKIYSGSGQVGQPAIIYSSIITLMDNGNDSHYFLKPVGHSHHSGQTGELYMDLSEITSALNIIDRAIVSIKKRTADS